MEPGIGTPSVSKMRKKKTGKLRVPENLSFEDRELLRRLVRVLRSTFVSVRTAKCEQTILLGHKDGEAVVSDATNLIDGKAGSALLNELRMQLGVDVVLQREQLKRLLVLGLKSIQIPLRSVGLGPRAPLCASLRVCGHEPLEGRLLRLTLARTCLPEVLLERIEELSGGFWWARRRWDGSLPLPTSKLRAFSADVPVSLSRVLHKVACFPRTAFCFSDGSQVYVEWGPGEQLWMRGTSLLPLVTLVRRERNAQRRPGAAEVLWIRGAGDVLV